MVENAHLTNRERMTTAAVLIEEVVDSLNDESYICDCCGLVRYEDFTEHQRRVELVAVAAKLRRFADG